MSYVRRFRYAILTSIVLAVTLTSVLWPRPVSGIVGDEVSGEPVADAAIMLAGHVVYSNQAGRFALGWAQGTPRLTVRADGYLPREAVVPKGRWPGQPVPLFLALTPNTLSGNVHDAETGSLLPGSVVGGEVNTIADEQGLYTLRRVRVGRPLVASAPGYEASTTVYSGQEVYDFALTPAEAHVQVLDLWSGQPVPNCAVDYASEHLRADASGKVGIKRLVKGSVLAAHADGYAPAEYVYDGSSAASIALRPNSLQGVVRDSSDGQPLKGAAVAVISSESVITHSLTEADGRYAFLDLPYPVTLVVAAADHARSTINVRPVSRMDVFLRPLQVKGIYMPLGILTNENRVRGLIDLVDRTELNAIVVDMKNDRGWLAYASNVDEAQRSGAYKSQVMDIGKFVSLCRQKDIYTIARLVVFKDSTLASAYPEFAVHKEDGTPWEDASGSGWSDPFRGEVQDYNSAIAKEVATLGFDELQFDYLRFPSDGAIADARFAQQSTLESRCQTIRDFCSRLRRELEPYAVLLSADVFGMTAWVQPEEDMGIGQRVIDIAPYVDYLSPMLYPATFSKGSIQYDEPLLHPYEVVYSSCIELAKRTSTRVRPWLQHYSWNNVNYGVKEMDLQKKAATDAQTYGWMFWNAAAIYQDEAFDSAKRPWTSP